MKKHMSMHTGEQLYLCKVCDNKLSQLVDLRKHMMVHLVDKSYNRNYCGQTFSQSDQLYIHMKVHTGDIQAGDKPFHCKECDKTFSQSGNLKSHIRIHTGEKPFPCKENFQTKVQMTNNMRKHKLIICTECNKKTDACNWSRHMKTHQNNDEPFNCVTCNKQCANNNYLTQHMKTHEKNKTLFD